MIRYQLSMALVPIPNIFTYNTRTPRRSISHLHRAKSTDREIYCSRAPGQGACLKGMSRTITMQGFRHAAISDVEKTKLRHKNFQSQLTVKYRSRALG